MRFIQSKAKEKSDLFGVFIDKNYESFEAIKQSWELIAAYARDIIISLHWAYFFPKAKTCHFIGVMSRMVFDIQRLMHYSDLLAFLSLCWVIKSLSFGHEDSVVGFQP